MNLFYITRTTKSDEMCLSFHQTWRK